MYDILTNFFRSKVSNKKIVFVIGSGRSGTHLLGRTIGNLEIFDAYIEDEKLFNKVTKVAVNPNRSLKDVKHILKLYEGVFNKANKTRILEKTHPNIWLVEPLKEHFSDAKFIGIKRDVYATVASMLNHSGVLSWYNRLPLNEVNPFLGINNENKDVFSKLPIESKCALRWKSHVERLNYLEEKYPNEVYVVKYEDFYHDYDFLMKNISAFLEVDVPIKSEKLNTDSIDKWKTFLTAEQINNIENVIIGNYNY